MALTFPILPSFRCWCVIATVALLFATSALAQPSDPTRRFPQPVVVGTLPGRSVLQPLESQAVLGTARQVVRRGDGTVLLVMDAGGFLGFGTDRVAVPMDAVALLGADLVLVGLTPAQLRALPPFQPTGTEPLPPDAVIRVGLTKPSH